MSNKDHKKNDNIEFIFYFIGFIILSYLLFFKK